jgi:CHAD domain-containing protein
VRTLTGGEVIAAAIATGVERLAEHDPGVRAGDDPEEIHQARVATRRLRSDLRTFRPLLDPEWVAGLRAELKWLADLLGVVRDVDVQLLQLRADVDQLAPSDARGADALLARLSAQQSAAHHALMDGMGGARYVALEDRLARAAADPHFSDPVQVDLRAGPLVTPLVRGPWKHLSNAVDSLGKHPSDDDLHEIRIRVKRCRYAAEAVTPAVGASARAFASAMGQVQDKLGIFHDAVVIDAWLRATIDGAPSSEALAAGQLIAMARRRAQDGRESWPRIWRRASSRRLRAWMS